MTWNHCFCHTLGKAVFSSAQISAKRNMVILWILGFLVPSRWIEVVTFNPGVDEGLKGTGNASQMQVFPMKQRNADPAKVS